MSLSPAVLPPPDQKIDFAHPYSMERWNMVAISVGLSLATVVFLLRSYVRLFLKRSWILEDYLIVAAWVGLVIYCAIIATIAHKHGGVHEWDLTTGEVHQASYWLWIGSIEWAPIVLITKVAILLFYRRIFLPHKGGIFDWMLRAFMAVLVGFYLITMFIKAWECHPRERIWNKSVPGKCIDAGSLFNASGIFNVVTDILLVLVPLKSVWKLQIGAKSKLKVAGVFTVGFCAPVFSIVGFVVRLRRSSSSDVTYNVNEISLWALAEVAIGLICVCIPELAALKLRRGLSKLKVSISRRMNPFGRALHSSDDQDLEDIVRLRQRQASGGEGFRFPSVAVITDIHGGIGSPDGCGVDSQSHIRRYGSYDFNSNEPARPGAIYTSIRMEQVVT